MHPPINAVQLRIYHGESDRKGGTPVYEQIVHEAQKHGLAGATVFRGIMGFSSSGRVRSASLLRLSENLPIVVEIVDEKEKIDAFLPHLRRMIHNGIVTLQRVELMRYDVE